MSTSASVIKNNGVIGPRATNGLTPDTTNAGGGVNVAQGGSFTMNGGEISGNVSESGVGLNVRGTATLNDGTISSNKKKRNGGENYNFSTLTTSELSTILTSQIGAYDNVGNVEIGIPGTFNMNGGTITQTSDMTKPGQNLPVMQPLI